MAEPAFRFSVELLREYCGAAIQNAGELIEEASLLSVNGHAARAYFLAVASIEETGKALHALDAQGRNLGDSAVTVTATKTIREMSR